MLNRLTLALLLTVLTAACATPQPRRVHTSAGVPQMPIIPFYPTKKVDPDKKDSNEDKGSINKDVRLVFGGEYQKGTSWDDEGYIGKADHLIVPISVWIKPEFMVGLQVNITKTIGVNSDDKRHMDHGLMTEWVPIRSDQWRLGAHLGYHSGYNSQETNNCEETSSWSSKKADCIVFWSANVTVNASDFLLAPIVTRKVIDKIYFHLTPGVRYTRIETINHVDGDTDIVHKKIYFSPHVSTRLSYESDAGAIYVGAGYTKNHGFGVSEGVTKREWALQIGAMTGY